MLTSVEGLRIFHEIKGDDVKNSPLATVEPAEMPDAPEKET